MFEQPSFADSPGRPQRDEVETYIREMLAELTRLARVGRLAEMEAELAFLCRRLEDGRGN